LGGETTLKHKGSVQLIEPTGFEVDAISMARGLQMRLAFLRLVVVALVLDTRLRDGAPTKIRHGLARIEKFK